MAPKNSEETEVEEEPKLRKLKLRPGIVSVEKGRQFEDAIADLYRLLGAEVIQNVEICQKKVDILAQFPIQGSATKHRVIVECKDEERAVNANQRVMQFQGLLDVVRKAGLADSAEIVTRVPWGDAAKGFAITAGISLLTYYEKLAQLIDFRPYMEGLIGLFEKGDPSRPSEPPLSKYYVHLSAEASTGGTVEDILILDEYVNRWLLSEDDANHLAVLGEYGSGKSSLCLKVAHDLAFSYIQGGASCRIPILLNLRDFVGTIRMEGFISSFLDQECRVGNPRYELFKSMNDSGLFFLIFDGLDEMAVKVDSDTLELNLLQIEKLAVASKTKVLITSRPEHFISTEEEWRALRPRGRVIPTRETEYDVVRIQPWNEKRVETFLKKRVPLIKEAKQAWPYYRDRIKSIKGLSDLSQRPVLLEMIVKTLPKLVETNAAVNLPNLYRTYLLEEIRRQKLLKGRTLLLTEEERLSLLRRLAGDIYTDRINAISFVDARKAIDSQLRPPVQEAEAYTREFLTNSFLIRKGDLYHFSHKSILEYLVAARIQEQLNKGPMDVMSSVLLQPVILEFLVEMDPDTSKLFGWIDWTTKPSHSGARFLGGNCATVLCALSNNALVDKDLSGANLSGANLLRADLRNVRMRNTILEEASLCFARLNREDLKSVNVRRALLSFYFLSMDGNVDFKSSWAHTSYTHGTHQNKFLMSSLIRIAKLEDVDKVKKELSDLASSPVAVFDEEYNDLIRNYGGTDPLRPVAESKPERD